MAVWLGIDGGSRARNSYWRMNELRINYGFALLPRLDSRGVLGPIRFEFSVADLQIFHHVRIFHKEVVASAGLEKLLLNRKPGGFVHPHLNLGYLLANFVGLGRQVQQN